MRVAGEQVQADSQGAFVSVLLYLMVEVDLYAEYIRVFAASHNAVQVLLGASTCRAVRL